MSLPSESKSEFSPTTIPAQLPIGLDPSALLMVVRIAVARQGRGVRRWVLAGVFALPIAFAILIRQFRPNIEAAPLEDGLILGLIFPALVPLAALLLASGMVQDDVEEQTLTYLLVRPIARWAIYLAKLVGTAIVAWGRSAIFTAATLGAIYWGDSGLVGSVLRERVLIYVAMLALATAAYASIFGALSLILRRALVVGAIYVVVVEGFLGAIDFVIREATVIYYIRVLAVRWLGVAGEDWSIDPDTAVSASTCVIVLLAIAGSFAAIGAAIFAGREFRLKTPEGN